MKQNIFVGMKKASKRNLHLLKRDMPMNEIYHISSFWSLHEFNDKLPFLWHLIVSYEKGEENGLLNVYILTRELYVFTRKVSESEEDGDKRRESTLMLACQDCEKNTSFQNLSYDVGQEWWWEKFQFFGGSLPDSKANLILIIRIHHFNFATLFEY